MKIYLAGGMEGLSFEDQTKWRRAIKTKLPPKNELHIIDPVTYYNFEHPSHVSIREPMEFDLWKVKQSDLVIVNYTYKPVSLGTMAEITTAYNFGIPIIGLAEQGTEKLHDWQKSMPIRIFTDMDEMIEHVTEFYLR